jgi:hypothetical protein
VLHRSASTLLWCWEGGGGGQEWRAAVIIGAFMAAITGVKWRELLGGDRCSSMARKKEGAASMAWRRWRRKRRRSTGAVTRKKRPGGLRGPKGRLAAGPVGPKVKENSFPNKI